MLEGHRAFDGKTAADVIGSVLKDEPAALTRSVDRPLPRALDRIVWRCIAKDPAARFQSASDLAFALQSLSPEGVADASGTLPIKSPSFARVLRTPTALPTFRIRITAYRDFDRRSAARVSRSVPQPTFVRHLVSIGRARHGGVGLAIA